MCNNAFKKGYSLQLYSKNFSFLLLLKSFITKALEYKATLKFKKFDALLHIS